MKAIWSLSSHAMVLGVISVLGFILAITETVKPLTIVSVLTGWAIGDGIRALFVYRKYQAQLKKGEEREIIK